MRGRKLISDIIWQGALQKIDVKQTGAKEGLNEIQWSVLLLKNGLSLIWRNL
jgi:hypothetical protein